MRTGLSDQSCGLQSRRECSPEGLGREGAEEYILTGLLLYSDLLLAVAPLAKYVLSWVLFSFFISWILRLKIICY